MKRYLPGRVELTIFATLAVVCAIIAFMANARDEMMSMLAFPIFVFAAVMGLWKSGRLRADPTDDSAA
jgi:thiamine transporter ThiT